MIQSNWVGRVNLSLAAYPGLRHEVAAQRAVCHAGAGTLTEPLFGAIKVDHVQLVPQNHGLLSEDVAGQLLEAFPGTQFRLHANVRVLRSHTIADLSSTGIHAEWFTRAALVSKALKAPAYTAHSGYRGQATLLQALDAARRLADEFGCPVGIEGQYPTKDDALLVSTWEEYQVVLESGVPYALDLSHMNILAHRTGRTELGLVQEMMNCERCIELHVSDNDGRGDSHQVCEQPSWWFPLLAELHPKTVVFTEGNQLRKQNPHGNSQPN